MEKKGAERRVNPRLDHKLAMNVAVNGYDFATATGNISCVGAYCHINKYMPPFTKMSIKLNLPPVNKNGKCRLIECKGVVVRSDDESDGGFNIAIFFNQIGQIQRKKITEYISKFLPS